MFSGFMCAFQCTFMLFRLGVSNGFHSPIVLYYSVFVATNALFMTLITGALCSISSARTNHWILTALALEIILWGGLQFYVRSTMMANGLLAAILMVGFLAASHRKARFWVSAFMLIQVLSWPVVNWASISPVIHGVLGIGYFLWLFAFALLFVVSATMFKLPNQSPDPTLSLVTPPAGQEPRRA